jgi:hypothetical protein
MRSVHFWLAGASAAFGLAAVSSAAAATIYSDYVVVYDASGAMVDFVGATDAQEAGGAFITVPIAIDPGQFKKATALLEGTNAGGYSDVVGICDNCGATGGRSLAFQSDDDPGLLPPSKSSFGGIARTLTETSSPVDITVYLAHRLQNQGYKAFFWSDADIVPEPTGWTMMLAGIGLAGVSLRRRSNARTSA